nr:hypothetical protein [Mesorhizobium loti]
MRQLPDTMADAMKLSNFAGQDARELFRPTPSTAKGSNSETKPSQHRRIRRKQYEDISMTNYSIHAKKINHYSYLLGMLAFAASIVVVSYFVLYEWA